jgi:predicted GH43/DUF377 family glycosyl hydrolase
MYINVTRTGSVLKPDQTRVLLRPFIPGDAERIAGIIARIMALPEDQVAITLAETLSEFSHRHDRISEIFAERFEQVRHLVATDEPLSTQRKLLIGAYFMAEYSLESAALFNPSIVPHPDQTNVPADALRFVLSLRATGEGHISSITFRAGLIHADLRIEMEKADGSLAEPRKIPNPQYEKRQFTKKLFELGVSGEFTCQILEKLNDLFTLEELERGLEARSAEARALNGNGHHDEHGEQVRAIQLLALSNYEVQFQPQQSLSQRIIFPATLSQRNGIEDARFVCFHNDDGTKIYYATFTAYDGRVIMPELVQTYDFLLFRFISLNGPAAENKGMALFPRKINGRYAMLARQDNENIYLMLSDDVYFWHERKILLKPVFPWELVQIGNCGSPIETDAGWLVLSHGVGAVRKYCIGAFLLDRDDPSKVIGRLREPLLIPNEAEREGYVPNVVYSCGALVHNGELIIPYALADHSTGFATAKLSDVLAGMK